MMTFLALLTAYLLGSIPFGVIIAELAGLGDLRTQGSGNIGATNVARVGGKKLGAVTLVLDALKGVAAVWIAVLLDPGCRNIAALAVVAGHIWPVFLGFKGGRGVATSIGALFAAAWPIGVVICAIWAGVFKKTRISSLASIAALWLSLLVYLIPQFSHFAGKSLVFVHLLIALLVTLRHRENISRLVKGEEKPL